MNEMVRLWSKDYVEVLFATEDRKEAKRWFLESGHDWLPIVIDYGTEWGQRWRGRLERSHGQVSIHQDREYLERITTWPHIVV